MTPPRFGLDEVLAKQNVRRQNNINHYPVFPEEVNSERKRKESMERPGS
jgi:hypothetical protein